MGFFSSVVVQKRVIYALLMREIITRYGRHNIGFLWLFVEPMMFTSCIVALWFFTKNTHGSPLPVAAFAITGYSCLLLWRNTGNRCAKAIEPNLSLMYHRNVKVQDILLARILLEIMGSTVSLLFLTIFFSMAGLIDWPHDVLFIMQGWGLLALFAIALGFIVGAISEMSEIFERVWHIFTYIMFPLGGAMYMVDWLPSTVKSIVLFMPMVHATEMVRHGFFGDRVQTYGSGLYLLSVDLVFLFVGLFMMRRLGEQVQPE